VSRRVLVLRGRSANPWDLRPWRELGDPYDVAVLVPDSSLTCTFCDAEVRPSP